MALSDGNQSASYGAVDHRVGGLILVGRCAAKAPPQFGSFAVLCTAQGDAKQNGLFDVSRNGTGATWTRRALTAPSVQVTVASGSAGGIWIIVGTPVYGTDNVTVNRLS